MVLDIGDETLDAIANCLATSRKTVVWNGPMGMFETPPFGISTLALTRRIARLTTCSEKIKSIAGGGDCDCSHRHLRLDPKFTLYLYRWRRVPRMAGGQNVARRRCATSKTAGGKTRHMAEHVIIIHTLEQAVTALKVTCELQQPIILQSAPDAIFYAGSLYVWNMFEQAQAQVPQANAIFILDCTDAGAETIAAMSVGHKHIRVHSPAPPLRWILPGNMG